MSLALALDAISAARSRGVPLKEIEMQRLYSTAMLGLKAPGSGHLGIRMLNEMNEVGIARAELSCWPAAAGFTMVRCISAAWAPSVSHDDQCGGSRLRQ
jgi:hypothetical protein